MNEVLVGLKIWLKSHNPILGLDFDGTLVPLHKDPELVKLSPEGFALLKRLAVKFECAIISGRELGDLRRHVPLSGMHFIANHGAQLLKRDGESWNWSSSSWESWRARHLKSIHALADEHGGWIEDKFYSVTVHYREAEDERWWIRHGLETLTEVLNAEAEVMAGMMCWNVTPRGAPNKGDTALKLCRETGHSSLVYFGDEATDENIFVLRNFDLYTVKIGKGPTAAQHRLGGPEDVLAVLAEL